MKSIHLAGCHSATSEVFLTLMITVNLFTSGRHAQPLIEALKKAKNIKLQNIYTKLPIIYSTPGCKPKKATYTPECRKNTKIADVFIVADFGQIIPKEVLEMPKYGSLCVHPSLLPKYRGASPVQFAILNGDRETGVAIIKMDEKVDHGPIIAQFREEIRPDDTSESLYSRLFAAGGQVLVTILPAWIEGRIKPREQDHKKATYTKILTREDGYVSGKDLKAAMQGKSETKAMEIERKIRAFHPWPGTWTVISKACCSSKLVIANFNSRQKKRAMNCAKTKRLKILKAHFEESLPTIQDRQPIPILDRKKLVLKEVQLEGKKPVTWKQFKKGYPEAEFI